MMLPLLLCLASAVPQTSPKLTLGSPAPALRFDAWLKGEQAAVGDGRILVLDFWTPTNEQCVASQPYLSELAREFGARGVRVVGVSGPDERNTLEKTRAHLAEHAERLDHALAWDGQRRTWAAYVEAAGQRQLPCTFVIDAQGNVAWIGNPMLALEPVAALLAGTWNASKDAAALAADESELLTVYGLASVDPKGMLERLARLETKRPRLIALTEPLRFELALAAGQWELVTTTGNALLERAGRVGDAGALQRAAWLLVDPERPPAKPDLELALRVGEKAVELTASKDYRALETLAWVYETRGQEERAIEVLTRALEVAPPLAKASLLETLDVFRSE